MRLVDKALKVYETVPYNGVDFELFDDSGKIIKSEREFTELKDIVDYLQKKSSNKLTLPENVDVLSGIPYYTGTTIGFFISTETKGNQIRINISPRINTSIDSNTLD
jgi:hypothetical protein